MAYNTPKVVLTLKKQGKRPAVCPCCGHAYVVLYLATDVAKCQVCGRAWHPSDLFYMAVPGRRQNVNTRVQEAG